MRKFDIKQYNLEKWRKENNGDFEVEESRPCCQWCGCVQKKNVQPGKSILCEFCNTVFIAYLWSF